jgi:glycosyltransferase involved in cell wall biosynthesis
MSDTSINVPAVSVIVPMRNEAENIAPLVAEIAAALTGRRFEVICVNDGSTEYKCRAQTPA